MFEGYGQTECTAGATLSLPGDFSVGHVGAPLPCNLIKLVDVPEMDYYAKNNEGEVRIECMLFTVGNCPKLLLYQVLKILSASEMHFG